LSFLSEEFKPTAIAKLPVVEFATPKIRQNRSDTVSPTVQVYDKIQKRKDIIEPFKVDYHAIMHGLRQDGYLNRAVSKYVNSIFLRGYKNHSLKKEIERYLRIRLQMIVDSMPDHNHIDDFFQSIAHDLVAYANVYLVKIRLPQRYKPGKINFDGIPALLPNGKKEAQDPICAYEIIHPATMHVIRDVSGNIVRYEQWPLHESLQNRRPQDKKLIKSWKSYEIVHIAIDRESGHPYGTPFLSAVIDDVRLLRTMEDHVARLAFRFAFPFTQLKVGEAKPGFEATEEDLEYYKKLIQTAPPDATLVTNEKVTFDVIGAQGHAIDLKNYLEHFESRSFSGLGVSGVAMGRGDTASRSTADAMTVDMHDQIKHFQNVLARNISQELYRELLLEGGYDWYTDPDKNWCWLQFEEIEVENKIKTETHIKDLLQSNMITFVEARIMMGRQPFTDKDWDDTYLPKFILPQDLAKLTGTLDLDEHGEMMKQKHQSDLKLNDASTKQTFANADNIKADTDLKKKELTTPTDTQVGPHQTTTTSHAVSTGGGKRTVKKTTAVKTPVSAPKGHFPNQPGPAGAAKTTVKKTGNQQRPANQHGRRTAPKRNTESEAELTSRVVDLTTRVTHFYTELTELYTELQAAAIEQAHTHVASGVDQPQMVQLLFELTKGRLASLSTRYITPSFYQGIQALEEELELPTIPELWIQERSAINDFNERTWTRLIGDVMRPVLRLAKKAKEGDDLTISIGEVFQKEAYRLEFVSNTEIPQAFWFGYASSAHAHGIELELVQEENACEQCANKPLEWKNSVSARKRLASSPTLHPSCDCRLEPRGDRSEEPQEG
jgi:hypothetical protein